MTLYLTCIAMDYQIFWTTDFTVMNFTQLYFKMPVYVSKSAYILNVFIIAT